MPSLDHIKILRTNSENTDFIGLVKELDSYLAEKDGSEHAFYAQYNKLDLIKHVIIAYEKEKPVACGAIKEYRSAIAEVKRMYTIPSQRGSGLATLILRELEKWAKELGYGKCILETGKRQEEAVQLYTKNNYTLIPNYGQYMGMDNSLCFEKKLI